MAEREHDLSKQIKDSFTIDSTFDSAQNVEVSDLCKEEILRNLEYDFEDSDTATFNNVPQEHIEDVPFGDVKILFYEAQVEFSAHHYAQAILKIESVLLRTKKWLPNALRVQALFLKARCLFGLRSYGDCLTILLNIDKNFSGSMSMKERFQLRFLIWTTCVFLRDFHRVHHFFSRIIQLRHTDWPRFFTMFDKIDYLKVLLQHTDCVLNHLWTKQWGDGLLSCKWLKKSLNEAKKILSENLAFTNREIFVERHEDLEGDLKEAIEREW